VRGEVARGLKTHVERQGIRAGKERGGRGVRWGANKLQAAAGASSRRAEECGDDATPPAADKSRRFPPRARELQRRRRRVASPPDAGGGAPDPVFRGRELTHNQGTGIQQRLHRRRRGRGRLRVRLQPLGVSKGGGVPLYAARGGGEESGLGARLCLPAGRSPCAMQQGTGNGRSAGRAPRAPGASRGHFGLLLARPSAF
jgi:hypothetical protein